LSLFAEEKKMGTDETAVPIFPGVKQGCRAEAARRRRPGSLRRQLAEALALELAAKRHVFHPAAGK